MDQPKKKILIVEDEIFISDLYLKAFTESGYEVQVAADGQAGLEMAQNSLPDLVLLDIMLPKMGGITVLAKMKEDNNPAKNIPVYLLTNLGQESIIKEAFKLGAAGYLLKSKYLPNQIVEEVNKFLSRREKLT